MLSTGTKKRRSMSYPKGKSEHADPSTKYRRITEKNSLSAKLIDNEKRLRAKSQTPSAEICAVLGVDTTAPDPNASKKPWNFLSCCCLSSPRQVWYNLCESDSEFYRRNSEIYRKKHWWHSDRISTLVLMMKLCRNLKFRRETYHRAMDIFDRFMILSDRSYATKEDVNFMGLFIVYIAFKIDEALEITWYDIADYMCRFVTRAYLRRINKPKLELEILETLQWSLRTTTALDWAKIYMHIMRTHSIYKRVENLSIAQQSTPLKKRTKIRRGISDDEEVDLLTWAQLDNLVIGEPRKYEDWVNRIAVAQVLDLCTADLYSFNFTYRELGAAVSIWYLGIDDKLATKITGLKIKSLHRALEFVSSYGCIYNRIISCNEHFLLAYDPNVLPIQEDSKVYEMLKSPKRKRKRAKSPTSSKQPKYKEAGADVPETHGASSVPSPKVQEEPTSQTSEVKLRKGSTIVRSDTEVSLLELDVNSPDFLSISVYANIPKQKRLSILSPRNHKKQFGVITLQQGKTTSSRMQYSETVSGTRAGPSLQSTESICAQVQETQSKRAESSSARKAAERVMSVELECDCGNPTCNKLQTIQVDNEEEVEALRYELSIRKCGWESGGSMVVRHLPLENPQKRKAEEERDKDPKEKTREKCAKVLQQIETEERCDEIPQKKGKDEQLVDSEKGKQEERRDKVQKMEEKERRDEDPQKRKAYKKRGRRPKKGVLKGRRKKIQKMEKEEKRDEDPQKPGTSDKSGEDRKKEELKERHDKVFQKIKEEEGPDPQKLETEKRGGDSQKEETKKGRKRGLQKKRTKEECNSGGSKQKEEGRSSEVSPLHRVEIENYRMDAFLIQSPPFSYPVMKRVSDRLSSFWRACEIREPTRRRYSYPMRRVVAEIDEPKRRKSADFA